jgi:hypothetical protein
MAINVVLNTDEITVLGPPASIDLQVDIGPEGKRGSFIYSGFLDPNTTSTPFINNPPQLRDLYYRTENNTIYQYIAVPGGNQWQVIAEFNLFVSQTQELYNDTLSLFEDASANFISSEEIYDTFLKIIDAAEIYATKEELTDLSLESLIASEIITTASAAAFGSASAYTDSEILSASTSLISYTDEQVSLVSASANTYTDSLVLQSWEEDESGNIIPILDGVFDIGSPEYRVKDLYLSSSSLYIEDPTDSNKNIPITIDENGNLKIGNQFISTEVSASVVVNSAINDLVGTTPENLNTLEKLAGTINNDPNFLIEYYTKNESNEEFLSKASASTQYLSLEGGVISGDLVVSGSVTYTNQGQSLIDDNAIILNSSASGTPLLDATIEVNRGTQPNSIIKWNESLDKWQFTNDGTQYYDFITEVPAVINQKQTNFYDIARDYGAVPNETDSRTKIQNALNAARDAGGGIVYIPNGLWNLSGGLRIYSNTHLMLSPKAYMRKLFSGASMLWNGDNGASYSGYDGQVDITVTGGTWDARGTAFPTTPANIFSFAHSQNLIFRDITFLNVGGYHAIEINSTKNGIVDNCRFLGYIDTGERDFSEAVQIDGAFRATLFGEFGSYDKTICQDIKVTNCYFGASGFGGTTAWPTAIGSHSADTEDGSVLTERWHSHIKVLNNTFEGMTEFAVRSDAVWREATIADNLFINCSGGVGLGFRTKNLNLSWHGSFNFSIENNIFQSGLDLGRDVIFIRNVDGVIISNNHFRPSPGTSVSFGRHGIYISSGTEILITDNRFEWVNRHGIFIENGTDTMINNNLIKNVSSETNNTYSYILVDGSANTSMIANRGYKGSAGNTAQFGLRITSSTGTRGFGNFFGANATTSVSGTIEASTANG